MSETVEEVDLEAALDAAGAVFAALRAGQRTSYTDEQFTALLVRTERLRRSFEPVDHANILEAERRGMAVTTGAHTVPRLLCHLLVIDPGEARARYRAAHAAGARRSLLGEVLPPRVPGGRRSTGVWRSFRASGAGDHRMRRETPQPGEA